MVGGFDLWIVNNSPDRQNGKMVSLVSRRLFQFSILFIVSFIRGEDWDFGMKFGNLMELIDLDFRESVSSCWFFSVWVRFYSSNLSRQRANLLPGAWFAYAMGRSFPTRLWKRTAPWVGRVPQNCGKLMCDNKQGLFSNHWKKDFHSVSNTSGIF